MDEIIAKGKGSEEGRKIKLAMNIQVSLQNADTKN